MDTAEESYQKAKARKSKSQKFCYKWLVFRLNRNIKKAVRHGVYEISVGYYMPILHAWALDKLEEYYFIRGYKYTLDTSYGSEYTDRYRFYISWNIGKDETV